MGVGGQNRGAYLLTAGDKFNVLSLFISRKR